ncbi:MAG: apolipoprotein N-acyltransferase [Desulfobacterales bacterium]|nr:apolipoprotein N-acyltransferase [Desulfobacterales bacterium]MDX2512003.1 apolipoprotein N-acyltransferase [Desulfobacterales bacterium]
MTRLKQPVGITRVALACLSGLLLTASFPVLGKGALAWFALVPLLVALRNLSAFDGLRIGFLTGIVHYLTLLYWFVPFLNTYGPFPVILCMGILLLLSSYLAIYVGLFSMAITYIGMSIFTLLFTVPTLWVSFEFLRSLIFGGFPWELLGHTQYNALHIIQISDMVGVYGISFLILLSNGLLFLLYQHVTRKGLQGRKTGNKQILVCVLLVGGTIGAVWCYGAWRIPAIEERISRAPHKRIAVVQGNIDQTKKWDPAYQISIIEKYLGLSKKEQPVNRPDLIVWPETAMPFYFANHVPLTKMVVEGIQSGATDILLGSPAYTRDEKHIQYYNRAFLVRSDGIIADEYDKAHLVPFGEYVPLKQWLPFLGKMVEHVGDFSSGSAGDTLDWRGHKIGVLICYELIFPSLSRVAVQNGAELLINITNDAWYGKTSAPYQHFSMAVFRTIETRRALVRSANTGISGFIDPLGRVISETPLFQDAVIGEDIPLMSGQTPYVRFGDIFSVSCIITAMIIMLREQTKRIKSTRKKLRRK